MKNITYNRDTEDFKAMYGDVLVGFEPTYGGAERLLDAYAYDLATRQSALSNTDLEMTNLDGANNERKSQ